MPILAYHDNLYSPVGNWPLNYTFEDISGGGRDLSVLDGLDGGGPNHSFTDLVPGFGGLWSCSNFGVGRSSHDPVFLLLGDMTCGAIITVQHNSSGTATNAIVGFGGSGDSGGIDADNIAWSLRIDRNDLYRCDYAHEFGPGSNVIETGGAVSASGQMVHVFARRASNVVTLFVNGQPVHTSGVLTPPNGGGVGVLTVGGLDLTGLSTDYFGAIASVVVYNTALSDIQILERYTSTVGRRFPTRLPTV